MSSLHQFYLSLGSNIKPVSNLPIAIAELRKRGQVGEVSSPWESRPAKSAGPNFLNLCVQFMTEFGEEDLKAQIIRPVETALGRIRTMDKHAPRTIDIDVIMMDGRPLSTERWTYAFVLVPMAELLPHFILTPGQRQLGELASEAQKTTWIIRRPDALANPSG